MAYVRITNSIREKIVNNILKKTINVRIAEQEAALRELAIICRDSAFFTFYKQTEGLPEKYFETSTSFEVKRGNLKEYSSIYVLDMPSKRVPHSALAYGYRAKIFADQIRRSSVAFKCFEEMQLIFKTITDLKAERRTLQNQIKSTLSGINSYKNLKEAWPDIYMFWSPEASSDPTKQLIVQTAELRAQIAGYMTVPETAGS